MTLIVNGEPRQFDDNINVTEFMAANATPLNGTAIAVNGKICIRQNWETTILNEGDRLTVISAAFGG